MKKALILSLLVALVSILNAQIIKITPGSLDFLATTTVVDFSVDWTEAECNGHNTMQSFVDYRHEELTLEENKKEADKWKRDWNETIEHAGGEFMIVMNDQVKKAPLNFKENASSAKYKAVLKVTTFTSGKVKLMGATNDNYATMSGELFFYDASGEQVAVVQFIDWRGNPSTSIYTMGVGFRVNSLFKKAGSKFGQKINLMYFKKKKK